MSNVDNEFAVDVYDPSTKKWSNQAVPALDAEQVMTSGVVLH